MVNLNKHLERERERKKTPILHIQSQKIEKEEIPQNFLHEESISLLPKLDKDITRKENLSQSYSRTPKQKSQTNTGQSNPALCKRSYHDQIKYVLRITLENESM